LPPPPLKNTGWPWTEESPQIPDTMSDGSPWPKISIVTPSLNQGQYIEETIRSVLLQGYPDLEYIIIDGGSTDDSVKIINKYEKWMTYWSSEPDRGQSHAINKGFIRSTGKIIAWLNSDDLYLQKSLNKVATYFTISRSVRSLCGNLLIVDDCSRIIDRVTFNTAISRDNLFDPMSCPQPACFWDRTILDDIGLLNEEMHYVFDMEYWIRITLRYKLYLINEDLAALRHYQNTKTMMKAMEMHLEKLHMYNTLYDSYKLPMSIKRKKKNILRHINEQLGLLCLDKASFSKAAMYFMKSLLSDPFRYQNIILVLYLSYAITRLSFFLKIVKLRDRF